MYTTKIINDFKNTFFFLFYKYFFYLYECKLRVSKIYKKVYLSKKKIGK